MAAVGAVDERLERVAGARRVAPESVPSFVAEPVTASDAPPLRRSVAPEAIFKSAIVSLPEESVTLAGDRMVTSTLPLGTAPPLQLPGVVHNPSPAAPVQVTVGRSVSVTADGL